MSSDFPKSKKRVLASSAPVDTTQSQVSSKKAKTQARVTPTFIHSLKNILEPQQVNPFTPTIVEKLIAQRTENIVPLVRTVVGVTKKKGANFGRIFKMEVDAQDEMIKDSFKWLPFDLEDLQEIEGVHKEKGFYTEYLTPDGERVMGTRVYA